MYRRYENERTCMKGKNKLQHGRELSKGKLKPGMLSSLVAIPLFLRDRKSQFVLS